MYVTEVTMRKAIIDDHLNRRRLLWVSLGGAVAGASLPAMSS